MDPEAWNAKHAAGEHHFGGTPSSLFTAEAARLAPGRALELACGSGRNAIWLAEHGWRVTGIDFSDVALAGARDRAASLRLEIEWIEADVLDWTPVPGAFDLVALVYFQLPAAERARVLGRARAALAPGGTLVVVGHDLSNLTEGVGGPRDPRVLHTPEAVVAELADLDVVRAERVRRDTDHGIAIDTLVVARSGV